MFTLKGRQDGFRFLLPDEFIPNELNEKYTKLLTDAHSFITKPIDFINESMQKVQVFGFNDATIAQQQPRRGEPIMYPTRIAENNFMHTAVDFNYRSVSNPESLVDMTLNVTFRHTLGYINYMLMFESFFYQYSRDMKYKDLPYQFNIDLFGERGQIYSRIILMNPLISGMDMLDFDYTQPVANSQTFNVIWKYSNFDYQFIETDANSPEDEIIVS